MRVALVCPYAWDRVGGVQTHVRGLARALRARGHDIEVLAPVSLGTSSPGDEVRVTGRAFGIPFNGSIAPVAPGPDAFVGVRRNLARFEPDVVHVHEPLVLGTSLYSLLAASAPVVGTFHAAAADHLLYRLLRPVLAPLVRRLAARTAVSEAALALAARHFPGDYRLTPNGIDVGRFRSAAQQRPDATKKVLFLGRLEPRKGLEVLIRAMALLRGIDATLLVAGAGPAERSSRDLAAQLGVEARWLGRVPEADLARILAGADVFCHPATRGESFGIVLLEAMAAGAAVVCSDLPGFRAAAGDAADFFPPGDAAALAQVLERLLAHPSEAEVLRGLAAARADLFDWGRLVGGVETIYAEVVQVAAR